MAPAAQNSAAHRATRRRGPISGDSEFGLGAGHGSVAGYGSNGAGCVIGGGHDIRTGRNVSVTPFANLIGVGLDGEGFGVFQTGIAISVH